VSSQSQLPVTENGELVGMLTIEDSGQASLLGSPADNSPMIVEILGCRYATAAPLRRVRPKPRGVFEDLPGFFR
jgi:hypothetical protein